jgi:colanic acid/amylovoran biosynthesis glycosyltransferase
MRILFLAPDLTVVGGAGTFGRGFIAQARARYGDDNVVLGSLEGWRFREKTLVPDVVRLRAKARGCDLIHALTERAAPVSWALSKLTRVPYIISAHGTYADLAAYPRRQRWFVRHVFRTAKVVVPVSSYTASVARKNFGDVPMSIVPGGFDAPVTIAERAPNPIPRILSVGALKARKGFHTLVAAVALLHRQGVRVRLDHAGRIVSPPYRAQLDEAIRSGNLSDFVSIHGRVEPEQLQALYRDADVFVLASEHDGPRFEGLGLAYLEALSHGVPVIGSEQSGATDVIRPGFNGLLVPPGNPERLAAAIATLLEDRQLVANIQRHASESIDPFAWQKVGARMDEVWRAASR